MTGDEWKAAFVRPQVVDLTERFARIKEQEQAMSYFPWQAWVPTESSVARTFMISVNSHGEAVIYRIGPEGKAADFAAGKLLDVLGPVLESTGRHKVICYRYQSAEKGVADGPRDWSPFSNTYVTTWADLVAAMNGKGVRAARANEGYSFVLRYGLPIEPYIAWGEETRRYVVGPKGLLYDAAAKDA